MVLRVSQGGSGTIKATRAGGSPKTYPVAPPADGSPLTVKASFSKSYVTSIELSGTGIALESIKIVQLFEPIPPEGDLRLVNPRLPANAGDNSHSIDVLGFGDVELDGWAIRWVDALSPADPVAYYTFPAGSSLDQGDIARVFGGLTQGSPPDEVKPFFGGGTSVPALGGAAFQLVDPDGHVRHELAALASSAYTAVANILPVPDRDGARALLLRTSGVLPKGHWRLAFSYARDAGPGLPLLSKNGKVPTEKAWLFFNVE
jgi:hypothetical protein